MASVLYKGKQEISGGGGELTTKEALQSRILIGYSGNSLTNDMGALGRITTVATVSTAQKKLGTNSLSFSNQNQSLSFSLNALLSQLNQFSIGCWTYFNTFGTGGNTHYGGPWASWPAGTSSTNQINLLNEGGTSTTTPTFYASNGTIYFIQSPLNTWQTNTWQYNLCEIDTINLEMRMWIDNILIGTTALPSGFILNTGTQAFSLGGYSTLNNTITNMDGYIDEFVILSGNTTSDERNWLWNGGEGNTLA